MNKLIILIPFCCFISVTIMAQELNLSGTVLDQKQKPLQFVSVALTAIDSTTLISGAITNDRGQFLLKGIHPGNYQISISFIGYHTIKKNLKLLTNYNSTYILKNNDIGLQTVMVKANRSNSIKQSAEGQTFHLSGTASKQKDVLNALQEIPALIINPNTRKISLNDGSVPLILINGVRRQGGLTAINPKDILKVEVIPTSSAEFMHEGYTSVINVTVKPNSQNYTLFNTGFYSHPKIRFGMADAALEFGNNNYSFYISDQSFAFRNNKSDMNLLSRTSSTQRNVSYQRNTNYADHTIAVGGDRNWSEKNYSSFSATIDYIPQKSAGDGSSIITNLNTETSQNYNYSRNYSDYSTAGSLNFFHKHQFSKSALELLLKFILNQNNNKVNQLETGTSVLSRNYNFNNHQFGISILPAYSFKTKDISAKIGLNSYFQSNRIKENEETNSEFAHKQWDEYLYFSVNQSLKHFSFLVSAGMNTVFRKVEDYSDQYFSFQPVLNLSYKINSSQALTLNFNRKSTAPEVVQLNPYDTSSDSLTVNTGNPELKPYQTLQGKLNYSFTPKNIYLKPEISFSKLTNMIVSTGTQSGEIYVESLTNSGNSKEWIYSISSRYNFSGFGFIAVRAGYHSIQFSENDQHNTFFSGTINTRFTLHKFSFSGFYALPRNTYQLYKHAYSSPESNWTISYTASSAWTISLGMRFIGQTNHIQNTTRMSGYYYHYDNNFPDRKNIVLVGLRYKFESRKPARKRIKLENKEKGFRLIKD